MTKAQQILDLYDGNRTTNEIASIVGCDPGYVRVVARQRRGTGMSEIDRRYRQSSLGKATKLKSFMKRYHSDEEFRRRHLCKTARYQKRRMARDPEYRKRKLAYMRTYRAKRRAEARAS